jgi:hypothetical protein
VVERIFSPSPKNPISSSPNPYPDFSLAWESTMKNLALMNMAKTAIAIELYKSKHGTAPVSSSDLVPDLLDVLPVDYMDGEPLRYRKNPNGSVALYSVGDNGVDDGGLIQKESPSGIGPNFAPWNGKDWVWRSSASTAASPELSGALSENQRH